MSWRAVTMEFNFEQGNTLAKKPGGLRKILAPECTIQIWFSNAVGKALLFGGLGFSVWLQDSHSLFQSQHRNIALCTSVVWWGTEVQVTTSVRTKRRRDEIKKEEPRRQKHVR